MLCSTDARILTFPKRDITMPVANESDMMRRHGYVIGTSTDPVPVVWIMHNGHEAGVYPCFTHDHALELCVLLTDSVVKILDALEEITTGKLQRP